MQWVNYYPMPHPINNHNNRYVTSKRIEFHGQSKQSIDSIDRLTGRDGIRFESVRNQHTNSNTHPNYIWNDVDDVSPENIMNNRYYELSPLFPFVMMLIVSTLIFIVIVYRRWPGLVAGIIAGCLTSVSIYMLLLTLKEQRLVYE